MRPPTGTLEGMDSSESTLSPYERPGDDQIIVWVDNGGKPFIRGIYDELFASTAHHATYREFVSIVGKQAAEAAVRRYRMEGPAGSA
jgi:hypothetical protein